jgi:hypothetical protein
MKKFLGSPMGAVLGIGAFISLFTAIPLLFMGQWSIVIGGLALALIVPWCSLLAFLPAYGLRAAAKKLAEKRQKTIVYALLWCASVYQNALILLYSFIVFNIANNQLHPVLSLYFGFAVVMGPLAYMAMKEDKISGFQNGSFVALWDAGISYIILFGAWTFFGYIPNLIIGLIIIAPIVLATYLIRVVALRHV